MHWSALLFIGLYGNSPTYRLPDVPAGSRREAAGIYGDQGHPPQGLWRENNGGGGYVGNQ